ncbi:sensor histidine kinase [Microbacterium sp. NPDC091313]
MARRSTVVVGEVPDDDLLLPRPPGVIRRFWARHPRTADVLIALAALFASLPTATVRAGSAVPASDAQVWVAVALVVLGAIALVWRRRSPLLVVAACALPLALLPMSLAAAANVLLAFSVYAVAVYRSAAASWVAAGAVVGVALGRAGIELLAAGGAWNTLIELAGDVASLVLILLIGALLGVNVGNRRRYLAAVIDRSRQLLVERDQQARLAAGAERTRIAREMHDIVSHSLTVVVALSEGAIAADSPERARAASRIAADTARSALDDMRAMLGVLRGVDDDTSPLQPLEPLEPSAGVESAQRAGFPVVLEQRGATATLPRSIRFALGRVVQEGITNALRHAPLATTVRVEVDVEPTRVRAVIRNDGVTPGAPTRTAGFGLRGLRERVDLVGGTLEAGADGERAWRVVAVLPIPTPDAAEET